MPNLNPYRNWIGKLDNIVCIGLSTLPLPLKNPTLPLSCQAPPSPLYWQTVKALLF